MVTLQTAENALKTVYLGVVSNQLNINANPLLSKIKQSTADVWGKEIRKLAPYGINGGIGAGTEDGKLPTAASNKYVQFVSALKNLYGTIEISDKAIRASENNAGAFVNLLNAEMEGLIKASSFNFGRMLYGDGKGILASVVTHSSTDDFFVVDSTKNLIEGMKIDFYNILEEAVKTESHFINRRITAIDRATNKVYVEPKITSTLGSDDRVLVQGSYGLEITGLGAIFGADTTLYGVDKTKHIWMNPYVKDNVGEIDDIAIQTAIDELEEISGSNVDFITCSSKVKRAYQSYLNTYRRNVDVLELAGGYKAISYNGIPLISDRFIADDTMYLLNTKEFTLHQLCDWQWLEGEDGKIITQIPNYPTYTATLVKYADLICDKPNGQAKLSGITVA
jgi:hypothetical protein